MYESDSDMSSDYDDEYGYLNISEWINFQQTQRDMTMN